MYYHLTRKTRSFIYTCNYWGCSRGRGQSECGVGPVRLYFWQKLRGEGVQTSCLLHLAFLAPVSFGFLLLTLFFETQWFCYLTLSFSYVVGESLVLLRFKLRRLDMITKDDSPSSVTGVSHKFKDSKLWSCSATMWRPLSPNWKKRKSVPLRELILRMETVQSEWNFRLGRSNFHSRLSWRWGLF